MLAAVGQQPKPNTHVRMVRGCCGALALGITLVLSFELVLWALVTRPGLLPRGVASPEQLAPLFAVLIALSRLGLVGTRFARMPVADFTVALGSLWSWLLLSRLVAQAIAPGPPPWDPSALGASQTGLVAAAALAALMVWSFRRGERALTVSVAIATAWLSCDAVRAALLAAQPHVGIPANWTAEELAARGLLLAPALIRVRAKLLSTQPLLFVAAVFGPFLSALAAVGLAWIVLGAGALIPTTWPLLAGSCAALLALWAPLTLASERLVRKPGRAGAWQWVHLLRLAVLLALAENAVRSLPTFLLPGLDPHLWLLALLEFVGVAVLSATLVSEALHALVGARALAEATAGRSHRVMLLRRLIGVGLFGLAAKQLVQFGLALLIFGISPDPSWLARLVVYGVALLVWRMLDMSIFWRTGKSVGSLVGGPEPPPAIRRLENELKGGVALAGAAFGALVLLLPAFALTFVPDTTTQSIGSSWLLVASIGGIVAVAVRACLLAQRTVRKDEDVPSGPRFTEVEPHLGLMLAGLSVLVGLVGIVWAVVLLAMAAPAAADAFTPRLVLFGAIAAFGGVAAVEYRRVALRFGTTLGPSKAAGGSVLVLCATCVIAIAYGASAVVGSLLAPALLPEGLVLPMAQPLACLAAGSALLPVWLRLARFHRDETSLDLKLVVVLPMCCTALPLLLTLLARALAPMASPGNMLALSLTAETVGLGVAAMLGTLCLRIARTPIDQGWS